jgi:hypothetical protein
LYESDEHSNGLLLLRDGKIIPEGGEVSITYVRILNLHTSMLTDTGMATTRVHARAYSPTDSSKIV